MNYSREGCLTCYAQTTNSIQIFGEMGKSMRMAEIICKHFWFDLNENVSQSKEICTECWDQVSVFHEFYCRVEMLFEQHMIKKEFDGIAETYQEDSINVAALNVDAGFLNCDIVEFNDEKFPLSTLTTDHLHKEDIKPENFNDKHDKSNSISISNGKRKTACSLGDNIKLEKILDNNQTEVIQKDEFKQFFDMKCELCSEAFQTAKDALKHYRRKHGMSNGYLRCLSFQCSRAKFKQMSHIMEHIDYHKNPDKFKCPVCQKIILKQEVLLMHQKSHDPNAIRDFKCNVCGLGFFTKHVLSVHMASHAAEEDKKFICDICNRRFATKNKLSTHMQYNHASPKRDAYVCDICAKICKNKSTLRSHQMVHHDHTDKKGPPQKNFKCHLCPKLLYNEGNLIAHLRRMHTDTAHTCKICGEKLQDPKAYRKHMAKYHLKAKHKCTLCEKAFKSSKLLREHTATHTGETLYSCAYCPRRFASSSNMCKHKKRIHPMEWLRDRKIFPTQATIVESEQIV